MVIAVDPDCPLEYIFQEDRSLPKEQQTVIFLRPMTRSEMLAFIKRFHLDEAKDESQVSASVHELMEVLDKYVVGWKNLKNAKGKEITFDTSDQKKNMDRFTIPQLAELFSGLVKVNQLGEAEVKNL